MSGKKVYILKRKKGIAVVWICLLLGALPCKAQMTCGVTGLLHMPSADMQRDGTLMIGGNFLDKHNLPSQWWWGHDTFNYFLNVTFLDRLELAYVCTLVKGKPENSFWPEVTWGKFVNQDRHFAARFQVFKEGEWWKHMPAVVLGVSDPTTGGSFEYTSLAVEGAGNGYFNRMYLAMTKHFDVRVGELGVHAAWLYNRRTDYPLNGPAVGVNFKPAFHKELNLIAEYDSKTVNVGFTYSMWSDHFNLLFELQDGKYVSAGLVYKVNLIGGNRWKHWR